MDTNGHELLLPQKMWSKAKLGQSGSFALPVGAKCVFNHGWTRINTDFAGNEENIFYRKERRELKDGIEPDINNEETNKRSGGDFNRRWKRMGAGFYPVTPAGRVYRRLNLDRPWARFKHEQQTSSR